MVLARARPVQTFKDQPYGLEARIISAIGSEGPRNVAQIARKTGAHQETIRYKIKRQFVDKGFRFQADVDYRKLGLGLHWGRFVVSPVHYSSATKLFRSLNESAYLIHFSKVLPQGHFVALFTLPEGTATEFAQFLESLRRNGIITEFSLDHVSAQRHKSMDPSFFDFRKDRWDVDWEKVKKLRASPLAPDKHRPEMLADEEDLLLIKELQKDARQHVVGIGRKLKIQPKTLEYHYRTHVVQRRLIPGYRVRWMKDTDQPLQNSTVTVRLTYRRLDRGQYSLVQSVMNRLPYLWVEDLLESGTYIATLAVPSADFAATMKYINEELGFLGERIEMGYLGVEDSYNYTIPYQMFSDGAWQFDAKKMETAVLKELKASLAK